MEDLIYLDHNASTPVLKEVLEEMVPLFTGNFGNAASHTNRVGRQAYTATEAAIKSIASFFNCDSSELVMTSGATESINLSIKGVFEKYQSKGKHYITCLTEHKAVLDTFKSIESEGAEVDYLEVNSKGEIDLIELKSKLREDTVMVSIMLANNETGVIQNLKSISRLVHDNGSLLMSDITQAVGKLPVDLNELGIDLAVFSAHKFYGPKGVGGLYLRRRSPRVVISEQMNGGGHQKGRRSGTLNTPGIVGMASALKYTDDGSINDVLEIRNAFESALKENIDVQIIAESTDRLINTSMVYFPGVKAERLITKCPDLSMAMGSACTSASREASHVLKAMGVSDEQAACCIRFSFGRMNTLEQVPEIIESLIIGIQAVKN